MSQKPEVAVLGLGAMGHAFAANLLKKGFTVHGWNRTRARGEDLVEAGLKLTDQATEAVKQADVVIVMLSVNTDRILTHPAKVKLTHPL